MQRVRKNEAIWIDNESRWLMQIQVNGVRKKFYSSQKGKKGKIQAEKKADEWLEAETFIEHVKISDMFDAYIENMKEQDLDYHQYESIGKIWIVPNIGKKRFDNVTDYDFQNILNLAYKKGKSKKFIQNIRGCCTAFLKYCRQRGATKIRPELVVNKKAPSSCKRSLENKEIKIVFSNDKTMRKNKEEYDWYRFAYRFAIATGLRPSELCGLKRSDINGAYIHVQRAYNARAEFTSGKTENANRCFMLNSIASSVLSEQLDMLGNFGLSDVEWLFPTEIGLPTTEQMFYRRFKNFCSFNGIENITPYELRHTYVSINKDMPDELLKLQVGHSKAMQTREQYSHERIGDSKRAADIASKVLKSIINK